MADMTAVIDSKTYVVEDWDVQQVGRLLKEEWAQGWAGGMGNNRGLNRDDYYVADGVDTSYSPYIRPRAPMTKSWSGDGTIDPTTYPVYTFLAEDSNDVSFLYILNGTKIFKYNISSGVLEATETIASAVLGRPVLWKGNWWIPCGNGADLRYLSTIAVAGAGADTYTTPGGSMKALHFAKTIKGTVAQLGRAEVDAGFSITSDPTTSTAWGSTFNIGESTSEITDMHTWRGEIAFIKQDGVYLADSDGNAHPVMEFVGSTISPDYAYHGANSIVHGQYLYWAHSTGLWRIMGNTVADNIGFDAAPDWAEAFEFDNNGLRIGSGEWHSVCAYGRWLYATQGQPGVTDYTSRLFYGYIRDDGTVRWYGSLVSAGHNNYRMRVTAEEDGGAQIWLVDGGVPRVRQLPTTRDGSLRKPAGETMGDDDTNYQIWFPEVDFGEPSKKKQLRSAWVVVDNWGEVNAAVEFYVYPDGANSGTQVGTDMTWATSAADRKITRTMTPGTSDSMYFCRPSLKFVFGTVDNEDYRLVAFGMTAATPNIYRCVIELTPRTVRQGSVASAHQTLLDLNGKGDITIKEPEQHGAKGQWTGQVVAIQEKAISGPKSERGYKVTLLIERYDYGS